MKIHVVGDAIAASDPSRQFTLIVDADVQGWGFGGSDIPGDPAQVIRDNAAAFAAALTGFFEAYLPSDLHGQWSGLSVSSNPTVVDYAQP